MKTRILTSIVLLPLVIACIFFGGIFLKIMMLFVVLVGMFEFFHAFSKELKPIHYIGFVFAVYYIFYCTEIINQNNYLNIFLSLFMLVLLIYSVLFHNTNKINDTIITFFGFFYVCYLFGHVILIRSLDSGLYMAWLVLFTAWASDTGAYFVGKFLGTHKLIPTLSPNKTIEGAIGGIITAIAACSVFGIILIKFFDFSSFIIFYIYPIIGAVGSVLAQLGDLAASAIKRHTNIKDFGKIIPGHGGILDRFDSVLFTAPAIYYILHFMLEI